jgi:hypothetical protein
LLSQVSCANAAPMLNDAITAARKIFFTVSSL